MGAAYQAGVFGAVEAGQGSTRQDRAEQGRTRQDEARAKANDGDSDPSGQNDERFFWGRIFRRMCEFRF